MSGVGSKLKVGGGPRPLKNLDKQKKVFGMYKFAKKVSALPLPPVPTPMIYTTRKTAVVKPLTYNKGTCYSSLVILCVSHWSEWSMCLLVQLLCFFFHNKTRICNVIFLPIQLEVKYMPS